MTPTHCTNVATRSRRGARTKPSLAPSRSAAPLPPDHTDTPAPSELPPTTSASSTPHDLLVPEPKPHRRSPQTLVLRPVSPIEANPTKAADCVQLPFILHGFPSVGHYPTFPGITPLEKQAPFNIRVRGFADILRTTNRLEDTPDTRPTALVDRP